MYLKLRTYLLPFVVMVFSVFATAVQAQTYTAPNLPTVTSDKADYAPGEVAHITGSGWTLDDSVHVEFKETPDYPDYHIYDIKVNSDGTWQIDYQIELRHLGVTFTVVAVGKRTSYSTTYIFTDKSDPSSINITSSLNPSGSGQSVTFTVTVTGLVGGPAPTGSIDFKDGNSNLQLNVSLSTIGTTNSASATYTTTSLSAATHSITGKYGGDKNYNSVTSDILSQVVNTKASQTITFNPLSNKTYGDAAFTVTATASSGLPVSFSIVSGPASISGNTLTITGAGTVKVRASQAGNASYSPAPDVDQSFTVDPQSITITAAAKSKKYGDGDPALTYSVTSGSLVGSDAFSGSLTRDAGESVGQYDIKQGTVVLSNNYTLSYIGAKLTIDARPITITADAKSKVYGDADPALTYQITSGSLVGSDAFSGSLTRATGENAGTYAIQQGTVALSSNYNLTYKGADLTISQATATINVNGYSDTYDAAAHGATGTATGVKGEDLSSLLDFGNSFTNVPGGTANWSFAGNTNYKTASGSVAITISTRAVEVTADAKSKTYGQADPALTYKVTSGSLAGSDAFSGSLTRDAGEDAGNYAIKQGTLALNSNYNLTYKGANLSITTRAIEVTADAQTKVYGDADPQLTYQVTSGSLVSGDGFSGALTRDPGNSVGTYAIKQGTLSLSNNYTLSFAGASLNVTQRPITITADTKTKIYGDADPEFTAKVTSGSIVGPDMPAGSLTRTSGENVGTYAITQGTFTYGSNYKESFISKDLTITTRPITITADAKSKVYGTADPAFTAQVTLGSIIGPDKPTGSLTRVSGENVGTYAIKQGTYTYGSNYKETYVEDNLTITQRPVTVTADAKTKVYGENDPALTYSVTSGSLVNGDDFSGSLVRDAGNDVGTYAINKGTLTLGANYDLSFVSKNLTITARPVTITADAKTKVYGDADPDLTYQITAGSVIMGDNFSGSLTRDAGDNVGTYAINKGTVTLGTNYNLGFVSGNLTITTRPITITAAAKSKVYGDVDPALTYQVTSGSLAGTDAFNGSLTRVAGEDVGQYQINQGTVALSSNYNLSYIGAKLTITARAITITADPKTKVYGDTDPEFTAQVTSGNIVGPDKPTGLLNRVSGENVGTYAIQQGTYTYGSNYVETYVSKDLSITTRSITITADAKSKVYGDADPTFTYQVTSGTLVSGDGFSGTLTRDAGINVGTYAIQQGTVALSSNYTLSYLGANLTITARPITVTADAKSKVYGDVDPAFTAQVTSGSIIGPDKPTGQLTRVTGENIGTYAINQGTFTYGSNYKETYVSKDLTITTRPITITADAKSKVYGDADPALTYQITSGNLVTGDAITGTLSRAIGENVGAYAIGRNTLTAGSNYGLTYVGANLTITKRPVTVTAYAQTKYCGQVDPALTYQITSGNLVSGDNFSGSLTRDGGESVGTTYPIRVGSLTLGGNYDLTFVGANLSITGVSIDASASGTPVAINTDAILSAKVTPAVAGVSVTFTLDNGIVRPSVTGTDGIAKATVSGLAVGVYQVTAMAGSGCATSVAYLPVYDPNSGFVTGGGWINSPAGALKADATVTGKATFGFVAKYKKGSTTLLEGETEFQFQAGNLKFNSSTYDAATLVISGYKATYRGTGTINGTGSYKFMLAAIDGDVTGGGGTDKIRMKITDAATGAVVYDNQMGAADNADASMALGGGSIVIHSDAKKTNTQQAVTMNSLIPEVTDTKFGLTAFPNPTQDQFKVHVESSNLTDKITLIVYDNYGRTVRVMRELTAGQTVTLGSEYRPGIYYVEMLQGKNRTQLKLVKVVY